MRFFKRGNTPFPAENNGIYTYDRRFLKFDPRQMRYLHELVKK